MFDYKFYKEIVVTYQHDATDMYDKGFKYTRKAHGLMQSTKLLRIDLSKFTFTSENRRILAKFPDTEMNLIKLPYQSYDYSLGKWMKDFYLTKFGENLFSVQVIKKLFQGQLNMNSLILFTNANKIAGMCLCFENTEILHYAYPFYEQGLVNTSFGMFMMTSSIKLAHQTKRKYFYLGSYSSKKDNYKLQFKGLEWWNPNHDAWESDINALKMTD
ncbi:hypothetical protein IPJ91_02030 [bacterium]|nr:MAG: hypothetical protein IPJ91_02030 [bacterium]